MAVTGMGVVSPLGHSPEQIFDAARRGRSAIRRRCVEWAGGRMELPAASCEFDAAPYVEPAKLRLLDRVTQMAVVAAQRAVVHSALRLSDAQRRQAGVLIGTGQGGLQSLDDGFRSLYGDRSDRIRPQLVLMGMHNAPAAWIGSEHRLQGPNLTYSTACSSSTVAVGEAWEKIAHGQLDLALAGGAEAPLTTGSLLAWAALRAVARIDPDDATASCKPFALDRTGMVLGEGAAVVVLEAWERAVARGARIHGEVIGYGLATDIAHIARPSLDGQVAALLAALASAGIEASAVDAINAHGTGTQANDGVETAAIKAVFGSRAHEIPISATKSLHGHLLGAGGALELVLSLLAMQERTALPTLHLRVADPACDLDYVANAARAGVDAGIMLSNSFAFGGTNAVLALRKAPD